MKTKIHERGFVALMSVIVVSAILLMFVFTLGIASFFNRFDTLDTESKRVSLALAEACGNMAMVKIARDPAYTPPSGGECVSVSDACGVASSVKICKICSVASSGGMYTILARAAWHGAYSNLTIRGSLGATNFTVTSWSESGIYSGTPCVVP